MKYRWNKENEKYKVVLAKGKRPVAVRIYHSGPSILKSKSVFREIAVKKIVIEEPQFN